MPPRRRYETLDALRGVAAFAVVIYHLHVMGWPVDLVPHGYLAVDFFFMLSGFVMALRYRGPLLDGMGFRAFASSRLARIYPLAFAGALLGAGVWLCIWAVRPGYTDGLGPLLLSLGLNMALLPDLASGPVANHALFPENGALWSLFFELFVNFAWAAVAPRLGGRLLAAVLAAGALAYALLILRDGTANLGWGVQNADAGIARVCFGFTVGLAIERVHRSIPSLQGRAVPLVSALLLVAVVAAPVDPTPSRLPWWDLACVFVACPLVVAIGVGGGRGGRFGDALGRLSYPLYALHGPILMAMVLAGGFGAGSVPPAVTAVAGVAASCAAAWIAGRHYDPRARSWLLGRLRGTTRHP